MTLIKGGGGWPSPLGELGFAIHRLELPVVTSEGTVVIDVLATRPEPAAILVCEGKSGNNVEEPQARRYRALVAGDIRRLTQVPDGPVQVLYACLDEALPRIRMGLNAAELTASVLSIGDRARLDPAAGAEDMGFDVALPRTPPLNYIPVDPDSPDDEYREILLPAIVAAAAKSIARLTVGSLLEQTIPMWTHLPGGQVGRLREQAATRIHRRAVGVLIGLAESVEFRGFFVVQPRGRDMADAVVEILRSPARNAPQGETQGWQGYKRRAERTLRGRVKQVPPGQLSFEDLAREEGVGKET